MQLGAIISFQNSDPKERATYNIIHVYAALSCGPMIKTAVTGPVEDMSDQKEVVHGPIPLFWVKKPVHKFQALMKSSKEIEQSTTNGPNGSLLAFGCAFLFFPESYLAL
ncbi:hypothetical protein ACH5RR_035938 [Cinchona calisaya]|uniref:Uncharacterized protein n=1 Tax=Cinchona calisaya TaxID=153742 RepID=A0ABD2Y598_9GENT